MSFTLLWCRYRLTFAPLQGTWPFLSAISLQYPLKPIDVADDIESFLYLCVHYGVRFCPTSLSRLDPALTLEQGHTDELLNRNSGNDKMRNFVESFFYEEDRDPSGYVLGGATKLRCIKDSQTPNPGFTFDEDEDGQESTLSTFVSKFYKIAHEHYKAINWRTMPATRLPCLNVLVN